MRTRRTSYGSARPLNCGVRRPGMSSERIIAAVLLTMASALFLASIATRQGERLYDRKGPEAVAWMWLRTFRIAITRENCARFVTLTSIGGAIICIAALLLLFLA